MADHYKKIRRSHKGANLHAATAGWLLALRKEEIELEGRFTDQIKQYQDEGRCAAIIHSKQTAYTMYRDGTTTEGRICGEKAFQRGYCTNHFLTHVLYLPERSSGRAGRGVTRRPFKVDQFPYALVSERQVDLMNDLGRLPIATPLEDCIRLLNEEDPRNPLRSRPPRAHCKGRAE